MPENAVIFFTEHHVSSIEDITCILSKKNVFVNVLSSINTPLGSPEGMLLVLLDWSQLYGRKVSSLKVVYVPWHLEVPSVLPIVRGISERVAW